MSEYIYSVVMVVPVNFKDNANFTGISLGWGPNNFTVPLSGDGIEPITHYGLHSAGQQGLVDMLTDVGNGVYPVVEGLTEQEVVNTIASLTISIEPVDQRTPAEHFNNVISNLGLTKIE
jgi:hypothetical protein